MALRNEVPGWEKSGVSGRRFPADNKKKTFHVIEPKIGRAMQNKRDNRITPKIYCIRSTGREI